MVTEPAPRRFPVHMAMLAVVVVAAILAAAAWIGVEAMALRREHQAAGATLEERFTEAPIVNQREAWFTIGDLDLGVLEVRPLDDGRLGLRVLVVAEEGARGDCCTLTTAMSAQVTSRPGRTMVPGLADETQVSRIEDLVLAVPASLGRRFEVGVVDVETGDEVGSFTVELDGLRVPIGLGLRAGL